MPAAKRATPLGLEIFDQVEKDADGEPKPLGKGVRTIKAFSKGDILCYLHGKFVPSAEKGDGDGVEYLEFTGKLAGFAMAIDGTIPANHINDSRGCAACVQNCFLTTPKIQPRDGNYVYSFPVTAKFDIPSGTALFTDYGDEYPGIGPRGKTAKH